MAKSVRRTMMARGAGHNLPPEYQEVEWIQPDRTGNIAIELGCVFDVENGEIITKMSALDTGTLVLYGIGSYNNNVNYWGKHTATTSTIRADFGGYTSGTFYNRVSPAIDTFNIVCKQGMLSVYLNGVFNVSSRLQLQPAAVTLRVYGTNGYTCREKLWDIKIRSGGAYVSENYPCYRKSDNQAGIYDIVNNTFKFNTNTTWTVGPDV